MGPNLNDYQPIISDDFDTILGNPTGISLRNGDSGAGLWTTRTDDRYVIGLDGADTFFSNPFEKGLDGNPLGLNPFSVQNGILSIHSGVIPTAKLDDVKAIAAGEDEADSLKPGSAYYSGLISLNQTWSETYGYTEMRAKMPEGIGHLASAWLINTTKGSTPEIDMFEVLGRQNGGPDSFGRRDNEVNANVLYDVIGAGADYGKVVHTLDKVNDLGLDANGNPIYHPVTPFDYTVDAQARFGNRWVFKNTIDAHKSYDLNVFDEYVTYGTEWTPDKISFYIGPDSDHMYKFFETETPQDVTTNTSFLLWDRIGGVYAGNPVAQQIFETFSHSLDVDYIKVFARAPDSTVTADPNALFVYGTSASERVIGNAKDNDIFAGAGLNNVVGGGGADRFHLVNGFGNLVIEDFNPAQGDKVVLEGLIVGTPQDAYDTLTQVDGDVLLITGRNGLDNAQTIVFRDMKVTDFKPSDFIISAPEGRPASFLNEKQTLVGNDFYGSDDKNDYLHTRAIPIGRTTTVDAAHVYGGKGDDTYFLDGATGVPVEKFNEGIDGVLLVNPNLPDDYVLPDNVEIAALQKDTLSNSLIGNSLGNRLYGNDTGSLFEGNGGDDFIRLGLGADTVVYTVGKDGSDVVVGFGPDDVLRLEDTNFADFDDFKAAVIVNGPDFVIELSPDDTIILRNTKFATIDESNFKIDYGGTQPPPGGEVIDGSAIAETLTGGTGADTIRGFGGADILVGAAGDDQLLGGDGNDQVQGGLGDDFLRGGNNNDVLEGGAGADVLYGEAADDELHGGDGDDKANGGLGSDILFGDAGDDVLYGNESNDTLAGGAGDDQLKGGDGIDVAMYDGPIGAYDFVRAGMTIRVTDHTGREGVDTVIDVEAFMFNGVRIAAADLPF